MKVLYSICQQILEKSSGHRTGKGHFSFQSQTKAIPATLITHASKVMLKILQDRLQQYVNKELPDIQAGFRKGRGTRDQIASIYWIIEKAREFPSKICFINYNKDFVWITTNWGKFLKEMEIQDHCGYLPPEKCVMHVKKQQNQTWNGGLIQNLERSTLRLHIVTLLVNLCRVHHVKC